MSLAHVPPGRLELPLLVPKTRTLSIKLRGLYAPEGRRARSKHGFDIGPLLNLTITQLF